MRVSIYKRNHLPKFVGSENSDSVILFIHGLFGSYWTWRAFSHHLKNVWREHDSFDLEYDEYYPKSTIFFFRRFYNAYKGVKGANIETLAKHLKSVIEQNCDRHDNIVIIAHSMGGLIARQYIVDKIKTDKELGKLRALITYATPHHGSVLANYFNLIIKNPLPFFLNPLLVLQSKQIHDLAKNSDFIETLNQDWSKYQIDGKIVFKRVVSSDDSVVDIDSSTFIKDEKNVSLVSNKSHSSIIKPSKYLSDTAFLVTYNFLKHFRENLEKEKEYQDEYNEALEEEIDGDNEGSEI